MLEHSAKDTTWLPLFSCASAVIPMAFLGYRETKGNE